MSVTLCSLKLIQGQHNQPKGNTSSLPSIPRLFPLVLGDGGLFYLLPVLEEQRIEKALLDMDGCNK